MIWNSNLLSLIEIFLELYPTIQIKFIHTCCNHIQSLYNCWPLPFGIVAFLPLLLLCNHGCSSIFQLTFQLITSGSLFPQSSLQCSDLFLMSPLILPFLFVVWMILSLSLVTVSWYSLQLSHSVEVLASSATSSPALISSNP